jgi:hypothetical protein
MRLNEFFFFVCICLICCSCAVPRKSAGIPVALSGSYSTYQSNQGMGRGIIFRVPLQEAFLQSYTVDSFYINDRAMPFLLREANGTRHLEANYYVSAGVPASEGAMVVPQKAGRDSILMDNHFYPSWILVSGAQGKMKIPVSSYTLSSSTAKAE